MHISIPASIDEARASLDGLGRLLTAKQWERAAIVYAFTEPGTGGPRTARDTVQLSIRQFVDLGITGLRTQDQVRLYRKAWESAMQDGAPDVKPGDDIDLPDLPWKDHFGEPTGEVQERVARSFIANNPDAMSRIIRDEPASAHAIADQVMQTPAVKAAVEHRMARPIEPREATAWTPPTQDHRADLVRGVNLLIPALRAMHRGDWTPSPTEELLLHALGLLLSQSEAEPTEDLFAQIDTFLKERVA